MVNLAGPVVAQSEMTHGTLEGGDLPRARKFYEDVLGLRCVQHSPVSQLIGGSGSTAIVSVNARDRLSPQGDENRWVIAVGSTEAVAEVHRKASTAEFVDKVGEISEAVDGVARFLLRDAESNWWEVTSLSENYYQTFFERGDCVSSAPIA